MNIELLLEARLIPANSTVTKITGTKPYTIKEEIKVYSGPDVKVEIKIYGGPVFFLADEKGYLIAVSAHDVLKLTLPIDEAISLLETIKENNEMEHGS